MSHRKPPFESCPLGRGYHLVPDEEVDRDPSAAPPPIDFRPLVEAGHQVSTWLFGIARAHTHDPLDLAAIERVERAVEARLTGGCPGASAATEQDLLTVAGVLVTAFEVDCRVVGLSDLFGSIYAAADQLGAPLFAMLRSALDRPGTPAASAPARPMVRIPVVIRRRPAVAHGLDELGPSRTVLVIG